MNYKKISAIKFGGKFDEQCFKDWLKPYEKNIKGIRLQSDGEAIAIEIGQWGVEQKEEALRRAIQAGLKPSLVIEDERGEEQTYPIPIVNDDHPLLRQSEEDVIAFVSLNEASAQICLKEARADYLVRWILRLWPYLGSQLDEQGKHIKKTACEYVIQSCEEIKSKNQSVIEGTEFVRKNFSHLNKKRRKRNQSLHEVAFILYVLPGESDDQNLCGVMGSGTGVGIAHAILILFVMMQETPMLQEYVLNQFKKELNEV